MKKITPRPVLLRHARHYLRVANRAKSLYKEGGAHIKIGLELFNQEQRQIDIGMTWAREHPGHVDADTLLIQFATATAYIGMFRYDAQKERIPALADTVGAARRLGEKIAEGAALDNLGLAFMAVGDIHQAIVYHKQGLALAREHGNQRGESGALGNLGTAYRNLGDLPQAIAYYQQQFEIARASGDKIGERNVLGNLGNAYRDSGKIDQAIHYYEQHLMLARENGDLSGQGITLGNLGAAYKLP